MFQFSTIHREPAIWFSSCLLAVVFGFGFFFDRLSQAQPVGHAVRAATPLNDAAPVEVRELAHWAVASSDHHGLPFLIVDKANARLFAFDGSGRLRGSAPVLLGATRGDAPIVPATPAGRFVADPARLAPGGGLLWANGAAELLLHEPGSALAPGRAAQRLASGRPEDKRISDGSLHVPPAFWREFLQPLRQQPSVAYVLPEDHAADALFDTEPLEAGADTAVAQNPPGIESRDPL